MLLRNSIPNTVRPSATDIRVTMSGSLKLLHTKNVQAKNATSISILSIFVPMTETILSDLVFRLRRLTVAVRSAPKAPKASPPTAHST